MDRIVNLFIKGDSHAYKELKELSNLVMNVEGFSNNTEYIPGRLSIYFVICIVLIVLFCIESKFE